MLPLEQRELIGAAAGEDMLSACCVAMVTRMNINKTITFVR
jgi:hypothetical protein